MPDSIRNQLQRVLDASDRSITWLATSAGYSDHNVLSRFLRGKTDIKVDRLECLAELMGCRVVLVPSEPAGDHLDAIAAALSAEDRELLARLAAVLPAVPSDVKGTLGYMITGWEDSYDLPQRQTREK